MKINMIKINDQIHTKYNAETINDDGIVVSNIPDSIDEFRLMAIDTVQWLTGDNIKKSVGNTFTSLSASNSKAISLLAKVIMAQNTDTSSLTDLEKSALDKMTDLADNGYSDSQMLNDSLDAVLTYVALGASAVSAIMAASTHDEIIEILNGL